MRVVLFVVVDMLESNCFGLTYLSELKKGIEEIIINTNPLKPPSIAIGIIAVLGIDPSTYIEIR